MTVAGLYVSAHYFKSACVEVGGINPRQIEVNLRKRPTLSSQIVSTLGVGDFANLAKPVNKWNYFYSVNQQQTIQKQDFKLGYSRVFGFLVLKTTQLNRYEKQIDTFAPAAIILLSGLLFLLTRFRKRHQINNPSNNTVEPLEAVYYIQSQSSGHRELSLQEDQEIESHLAREEEREQREIEAYLAREEEQKQREINQHFSREERKKELREIEAFFYHKAEKELASLATVYQNNLAEMGRTILSLKEKFNDAEKKASILGVNLNDSNIDNLVKGRLFELFAAKIWDENDRTTIVDWTPDKGFNEKIFIKSNGNPDFVVSDTYKVVAVECKFRSRFNKDKNNEAVFVNFGKEKAINRYREYQTEKDIKVFLLLGVGGVAEHPDSLYLLTLDDIDKIRIRKNDRNKTPKNDKYGNVPTVCKKLAPYKIKRYELIDYLF